MMKFEWPYFKVFVDSRALSIQWVDDGESYHLAALDGFFSVQCQLNKNNPNEYLSEFESIYKANGNKTPSSTTTITDGKGNALNQIDTDNAQIVRIKAAKKGWTYTATAFEFKTSVLDSVVALNFDASTKSYITIALFDSLGVRITDPLLASSAVRTQIDFEPPYDYEVIGGEMRITPVLVSDMRLFIIAVPDVPYAYGGSRVMAENLNLRFLLPGNMFQVDGRVSKFLQYSSIYHTNKLRFVFWHSPGIQEEMLVIVEHFRQ